MNAANIADEYEAAIEAMRRDAINAQFEKWWPGLSKAETFRSEYFSFLGSLTHCAADYAKRNGVPVKSDPSSNDPLGFDALLRQLICFVDDLAFSLNAYSEENTEAKLWTHDWGILARVKNGSLPHISRSDLEMAVGEYLELPFRSQLVDRALVDLLIVTEVYSYLEDVVRAPYVPGISQNVTLKFSPTLNWAVSWISNLALWAIIAVIFWGLSVIHLFPGTWLPGLNFLLGCLFGLSFIWATVWLPVSWIRVGKRKAEIRKLFSQMSGVYTELRSSGPVSANHILHRARSAADAGVGWPAPLFVLLDDVLARGGSL
jgi:hypothetical protein